MASSKVLVLIEEHYDETEYNVFNSFFPEQGFSVDYASYLWGQPSLSFEGNDKSSKVEVQLCVTQIDLQDYAGLILIGGYAMDRLRYQASIEPGPSRAPAVELLRKAVARMDAGQLVIGTICHSLWLFCADPALLRGRTVTCAHNIVCDVENAGGVILYEQQETAETACDGLLVSGRHPGVVDEFNQIFMEKMNSIS